MKKIRRLPTILGIILVVTAIAGGIVAIRQGSSWFLQANPETIPKQVKTTNITDKGFAVSWITAGQATGFVKYGPDQKLSFTLEDDRDQTTGKAGGYFTHYFTLENLNPNTTYLFKINSNGKLFDNNGQPYQVTTAPSVQTSTPPSDVAYGNIIKADGSPVSGAIVYLNLTNATPQSAITKSSGNWLIPLNLARSTDLANYAAYDKETAIEEIFVQAGSGETATAIAFTRYDSPLPDITLGQSFDFRKSQTEGITEEEPLETDDTSKFNLGGVTPLSDETKPLTIINPLDKEGVNTTKPNIIGTAPAGKALVITIESPTQTGTVIVDESGNWEWSPPENLEPGEHTITIRYTDEEGELHSLTRLFTVLAAGEELPAIESTPSATIAPSPTPTPTPTLSPTPTSTPSSRVSVPSTESGILEPGYLTPTFSLFIMGLVLIGFGLFSHRLLKKRI